MKTCFPCTLVLLLILASADISFAQSSKKSKKKTQHTPPTRQPNTLQPYYPQKEYGPKQQRGKSQSFFDYNGEKRYYERLEEVTKAKRKAEKEMMKPQYSDPMYFGHKKPPKKRKPGKMKYCKECGLRH